MFSELFENGDYCRDGQQVSVAQVSVQFPVFVVEHKYTQMKIRFYIINIKRILDVNM